MSALPPRADISYDKAIALNPNDASFYSLRGDAYEEKGDIDRAIADFRKVLEIDPSDQDAEESLRRLGVTPDTSTCNLSSASSAATKKR